MKVTVTLMGCDDTASQDFDVTDAHLEILGAMVRAFGENEEMSSCKPGMIVYVHDTGERLARKEEKP